MKRNSIKIEKVNNDYENDDDDDDDHDDHDDADGDDDDDGDTDDDDDDDANTEDSIDKMNQNFPLSILPNNLCLLVHENVIGLNVFVFLFAFVFVFFRVFFPLANQSHTSQAPRMWGRM